MNLDRLKEVAKPGDIILLQGSSFLSDLIRYGQHTQTVNGLPSQWSHVVLYIDSLTIAESTIDTKPYVPTGKRTDNGPQYNDLDTLSDYVYGELKQFQLSTAERQIVLDRAGAIIASGTMYAITGLFGSLLSYYILDRIGLGKANPLCGNSLYCSAFVQECYGVLGIDFDQGHTAKNTSPEMISQYVRSGQLTVPLF